MSLSFCLVPLLALATPDPQTLPKAVVLEIQTTAKSGAEPGTLYDLVIEETERLRRFRVFSMDHALEKLSFEQAVEIQGCDSVGCATEIGRLLEMDYVVTGTIEVTADKRLLALKLYDVKAGKLLVHAISDGNTDTRENREFVIGAVAQLRPPRLASQQDHDEALAPPPEDETKIELVIEPPAPPAPPVEEAPIIELVAPPTAPALEEPPALPDDRGLLLVDSVPSGAMLELDGVEVGITPQTLSLEPGGHKLRAKLESHIEATQLVQIDKGEKRELTLALIYRYPGRLRVTNAPPGAIIEVGGERRGEMPRDGTALSLALPSGVHKVKASHPGFIATEEMVYVSAGEAVTMNLRLIPVPPPYKRYALIGLGGGAASLGLGALAAYKAKSAADDFKRGNYDAATASRRWAGVMYAGVLIGVGLEVAAFLMWQRLSAEPASAPAPEPVALPAPKEPPAVTPPPEPEPVAPPAPKEPPAVTPPPEPEPPALLEIEIPKEPEEEPLLTIGDEPASAPEEATP